MIRDEDDRQPAPINDLVRASYSAIRASVEMAGATGFEPATFGVTGTVNGINDSC
jgi:hypothetical protein